MAYQDKYEFDSIELEFVEEAAELIEQLRSKCNCVDELHPKVRNKILGDIRKLKGSLKTAMFESITTSKKRKGK